MAIRYTKFVRGSYADRTLLNEQIVGVYTDFFQNLRGLAARKAMVEVGITILENTLPLTPWKTGALYNTGRYRVERSRQDYPQVRVVFGDVGGAETNHNVDYAVYVELNKPTPPENKQYTKPGTGHSYLTEGTRQSHAKIIEIVERVTRNALETAAKKARARR